MNQKLRLACVLAAILALTVLPAMAAQKTLHGHIPAVTAGLTANGSVPATRQLRLAIGVPLHDPAGLQAFLADVYNPASPNYRHFLTPEEFAARFGPTEVEYEAVKNFARTNGLAIAATHGNRLLLDVTGPAGAVEKAFHVSLRTYRHPTENRDFFAPDTEPSVDASLPVVDVSGLNDYARPHPKVHRLDAAALQAGVVTPHAGSGPGSYFLGTDFRNAYVPGTTLDGTGQVVGLVQFDGYFDIDITNYENLVPGTPRVPVQPVKLDGYDGTPTTNGNIEVSLDIEMAISMAPNLSKIVVFEGNPTNGFFIPNDVLNNMAASNMIKNLSCSWGWNGGPNSSTETIFQTMAAQGQSFFNASGDGDAFTTGQVDNAGFTGSPSSSPNITQVGGTTLTMNGAGASYGSETVWNRGNGTGSSGGISSTYSIPGWQQGVNLLANGGSTTQRNIPDVALTAENVYVSYGNNQAAAVGGTSCAAPLWAGFMALVNQQAAAGGKPVPGFINPAIYELANESVYNSVFHDTTTGNNTSTASPNAFFAGPNYDLCTGLGTPNGTNLINALLNPEPLMVISNAGFNAVGTAAGTYNIAAQTFLVTNAGASTLTWSLINTSAWLTVSTNGGPLAAGTGYPVVVSLNNTASNLPAGFYTASLEFSNVNSGVARWRLFTVTNVEVLTVLPPARFTFTGTPGGSFTPASQTITLTNSRISSVNWGINNTSAWFNVSPGNGTVAARAQTNLTFTLTPAATNLAIGSYTNIFQVTNLTSPSVQTFTGVVLVSQSLALNGGFETGDLSSWAFSGTSSDNGVANASKIAGLAPHSGTYYMSLGESGGLASITQNLSTAPGQLYLLSVWVDSAANPFSGHKTTPNEFQIVWNGTTILDKVNIGKVGWTNWQVVVLATNVNSTLLLAGRDDNYFLGLDDITLIPGFAPFISTQPTNLVVLAGGSAIFSAAVSGSTNLAYQWLENGTNIANGAGISGATNNILTLSAVTANSAANYALVVTNLFGVATSSVATLTVVVPAAIAASSLTNRTIECGGNAAYAVAATGTPPLGIQWSLDSVPVSNATNTSFTLTNIHLPNHTVTVVVTNLYGSLTSNAVLAVNDTQGPVITLNGLSLLTNELGSIFIDPGATAIDACAGIVPVTTNGVVNTAITGTNTLTYKATDGNGNTNTATRTVIIRDTTPPTITWSFTNLVLTASTNCSLPMPDVTGTNFIHATDLSGALTVLQSPTNNFLLPVGTNAVVLTVKDASGNAAFSTNTIVVQDHTPPNLVLIGGSPYTNELGAAFTDPGVFAGDACAGTVSLATNGVVNVTAIGTNTLVYIATDASGNTNAATRTVIVRDSTPPTILWSFTNLVLVAGTNCSALMTNVTGTNFILAADLSGPLTVTQSPTNGAVLLVGTNAVVIALSDAYSNTAFSTNMIIVQDRTPPVILTGPQSRTNAVGTTAGFTVAATACTPVAYLWFSNNIALTVQTNSTLTLANVTPAAAGNYYAVASASGGSVTSLVAVLTVYIPPGIGAVAANLDGSCTLNLLGAPGTTYVLEANTNLGVPSSWLPLATNTLGTNGLWQFTDPQATNHVQQFYRLKQVP
ncbi:MAG: protease pro-enzyme activation domain-containing protein [Verrucomicrobiae bacterium]|nr:protease pro-enzyme activation domain-containing protein [Verrucomicrobiae bacterium]